MAEQEAGIKRRRSRSEVDRLVATYDSSGLTQREFCTQHGFALATLARYRRRRQETTQECDGARFVAVEMAGVEQRKAASRLTLVLASGRRIEVGDDFAPETLRQLVRALEQV